MNWVLDNRERQPMLRDKALFFASRILRWDPLDDRRYCAAGRCAEQCSAGLDRLVRHGAAARAGDPLSVIQANSELTQRPLEQRACGYAIMA